MKKSFKAGDTVRISLGGGPHPLDKSIFTVEKLDCGEMLDFYGRYKLYSEDEGTRYYGPENLELVKKKELDFPCKIKFNDIEKNDLVRVTRTYENGGEAVLTLRVSKEGSNYSGKKSWKSEDGHLTILDGYVRASKVEFELLDRPKAKLPTETGSLITITKAYGKPLVAPVTALKTADWWVASRPILGYAYLHGPEINEWTLLEANPVE